MVCAPLPGLERRVAARRARREGHERCCATSPIGCSGSVCRCDDRRRRTQELLGELGRMLAGAHLLGEAGAAGARAAGAMAGALAVPLFAGWLRANGLRAAAVDPRELPPAVARRRRRRGRRAALPGRRPAGAAPRGLGERLAVLPPIGSPPAARRAATTAAGAGRRGADRAAAAWRRSSRRCVRGVGDGAGLFTADPQLVRRRGCCAPRLRGASSCSPPAPALPSPRHRPAAPRRHPAALPRRRRAEVAAPR